MLVLSFWPLILDGTANMFRIVSPGSMEVRTPSLAGDEEQDAEDDGESRQKQ